VSNFIEKAPNVRVKNPVHLPSHDSHPERIQRIVLASPRSEPHRRTPRKVLFINLIEDRHHACWTILSSSAAIPNGRCRPSALDVGSL